MANYEKLRLQILSGESDANVSFADLCQLMRRFGFDERTSGSHHIFRKSGVEERVNLQKDGNKVKPYQVRQVRSLIVRYRLGEPL